MQTVAELVLKAYDATDRHISDSDLDDEQTLTLDVRMTLGDIRRIRRTLAMIKRGAERAAKIEKEAQAHDGDDAYNGWA